MKKSKGMELMEIVSQLEEIETMDTKLTFAIFRSSAKNKMEEKLLEFTKNINQKIEAYGIQDSKTKEKAKDMIERFQEELNKIYVEYENSVISIQLEMQEAESNQKIAIANLKKVSDTKKEALATGGIQKNSKEENFYDNREIAYIKKFNDYNVIIDECLIETEICRKEFLEVMDSIEAIPEELSIIKELNPIQKFIEKIKNSFSGTKRFNSEFAITVDTNLDELKEKDDVLIKKVSDQNNKFIATIIVMRKNINRKFEVAVS